MPLDFEATSFPPFPDVAYQFSYFVSKSLQDALTKMRYNAYSHPMIRDFMSRLDVVCELKPRHRVLNATGLALSIIIINPQFSGA